MHDSRSDPSIPPAFQHLGCTWLTAGASAERYSLKSGEPAGTRTQGPRLKRAMLYRLSYRLTQEQVNRQSLHVIRENAGTGWAILPLTFLTVASGGGGNSPTDCGA